MFLLSLVHAAVPLIFSRVYQPVTNDYFDYEWSHARDDNMLMLVAAGLAVLCFGVGGASGLLGSYWSTAAGTVGLLAAIVAAIADVVNGDDRWKSRKDTMESFCDNQHCNSWTPSNTVPPNQTLEELYYAASTTLAVRELHGYCPSGICPPPVWADDIACGGEIGCHEDRYNGNVLHLAITEHVARTLSFLVNYTLTFFPWWHQTVSKRYSKFLEFKWYLNDINKTLNCFGFEKGSCIRKGVWMR